MDDLRRQVRMLEGELKRKNQVAEKPYDIKKVQSPREPPPPPKVCTVNLYLHAKSVVLWNLFTAHLVNDPTL